MLQGPPVFNSVTTPLRLPAWEVALRAHPDRAFARYLLSSIKDGFRIGFDRRAPLKSASRNMPSAIEHPEVIQAYLDKKCALIRILGPFRGDELLRLPPCHINQFGVIPKGHNMDRWRLITDLSYPPGESVNDGIDPALCSQSYISVEQVAAVAAGYGEGALLAKNDIECAYRLILVHPHDRPVQAMRWNGDIYVDSMLPFGLRSAPKFFMQWQMHWNGTCRLNMSSITWMTLL